MKYKVELIIESRNKSFITTDYLENILTNNIGRNERFTISNLVVKCIE